MKTILLLLSLLPLFTAPAFAEPDQACVDVTDDQTKWDGRGGTFFYCSSEYTPGPEDGDPTEYRLDCFVVLNGVILQRDDAVEPLQKLPMDAGVYRFRHAGVTATCTATGLTAAGAMPACVGNACGVLGPFPADFPGGDPDVPLLLEPDPVP